MIFGKSDSEWEELKATFTSNEIYQQASTWKKTLQQIKNEKEKIQKFIDKTCTENDFDIIFTGAGTSEFVGNTVYSLIGKSYNFKAKSYGTTDIVATPENYLSRTKPTLLVSFARSGDSPESVAAVKIANQVCQNISHLFITCNIDGALSKFAQDKSNCYALNLTPETNDKSFAMTSSFSNMYLAAVLAFNLDKLDEFNKFVNEIADKAQKFVDSDWENPKHIVDDFDFKRIVYLGSNCLKGVSQESALKMCELTAGKIVTVFDTPMGFRHGPKSVIDDDTLTVVYMSDDEYSRKYEYDIIKEMSGQRKGNKILAVSSKADNEVKSMVDYFISFDNSLPLNNAFLGLEYIIVAQIIAIFKSMSMNCTPDNPCPTGEVNRVVQGVTIHPYSA